MPEHSPRALVLQPLFYGYAHLTHWRKGPQSPPFWRLYWNPAPGAVVATENDSISLTAKTILLIPPHTPIRRWLEEPVDSFYLHFLAGEPLNLLRGALISCEATTSAQEHIRHLQQTIQSGHHQNQFLPASLLHCCALITDCLCTLPNETWPVLPDDPRIRACLAYMDDHLPEPLRNDTLAAIASMSTNGFIRHFRQTMGQSPQAYLQQKRLEKACFLLHRSTRSIDAIAEACGFCDRHYFSRQFTKHMRISPAAFRHGHP